MPDRWLGPNAKACEAALSVFSKGPRSCFGVNLAYAELYLGIAHLFRRFELRLDESRYALHFSLVADMGCLLRLDIFRLGFRPASLEIKEHFVPLFIGEHLHAYCKPAEN